jgi:hypothetical protein
MSLGFGISKTSSGGGGGGTSITTVANYSALPSASSVSGKFYWCEASQGTKWLPFSVGGTYYPLGMYYSNGTTWEYTETPYQATLSEVNTGTNTDKFVSPYTFTNADKWNDYLLVNGTAESSKKEIIEVINKTGSTLTKGTIIYIKSTSSSANYPEVLKASATTEATSSKTIGAIYEDILNDAIGFVVTSGEVSNLDTSIYSNGTKLWLSTTDGEVTSTPPVQPNHAVFIGHVTRSQSTNGRILYAIQNGYELNELHDVLINPLTLANNNLLVYNSSTGLWINKNISDVNTSTFIFIDQKSDLPTAVGGVITLLDNYTYFLTTTIDLTGDRIVGGINTTILGASSENCYLKSTGLSSSTALISSSYSMPLRNFSITHWIALDLDGDGVTTALDWFGMNFVDCQAIGTIKNYTNFIMQDSAFLNSGGLIFDGTIGTIGFTQCLFDNYTATTAITIAPTCVVSRRFRIIYSSFVTLSGETSVNVSASATIGDERYILDTVNFGGGGTYQIGLDATSNKSLFANCVGITNTSTRGFISMLNNITATPTNNTALFFKASGTTSPMPTNSKFSTAVTNRLTYTGAFTQSFMITVNCNIRTSVSTQTINIAIAKNGTTITESIMTVLIAAGSIPSFGATQIVVELTTNDYVELFVQNASSANNTTIQDMNMNCVKIPV